MGAGRVRPRILSPARREDFVKARGQRTNLPMPHALLMGRYERARAGNDGVRGSCPSTGGLSHQRLRLLGLWLGNDGTEHAGQVLAEVAVMG